MSNQKNRVEPEVSIPEGEDAAGLDTDRELNIEDIVPGLEEEIAKQDLSPEEETALRIAELEAERDALTDKWKRAVAEAENVRRRAERDKKDAQAYGGTRLARDLLSVHDNLERAMKAADDDMRKQAAAFIEGVELTQRELLNAFAKHKIEQVTPEPGEKFDPNRHQAMFEAPIPGAEPGTVIECMQDGFVIADRLLRPALVGVAKAGPVEVPAEPKDDDTDVAEENTDKDSED
ncbi:MAG: nucleotide exchange factor GrpE [Pseudomonadota bacterium]